MYDSHPLFIFNARIISLLNLPPGASCKIFIFFVQQKSPSHSAKYLHLTKLLINKSSVFHFGSILIKYFGSTLSTLYTPLFER